MTKVSVIVPVYNVEEYLEKCLDSLVNQTFDDYEIIVVNDGSPDNSQKIIDKYEKKYPKLIKGYKKKNGGLSSARNYGLAKATGEYISFIDSDDYIDKNFIKKMYKQAIKEKAELVVCDIECYGGPKGIYNIEGLAKLDNDIKKDLILSPPSAPNKMFKKELFSKELLFPEGLYYEDLATIPRIISKCNKIAYVNESLYYYLVRQGSIMNQKFNHKISDIFKVMDIIYDFFENNNFIIKYKDELEYIYINQLLHSFGLKFLSDKEGYKYLKQIKKEMDQKFPKWHKNKYYKKYSISKKIMCHLIYQNQIKLINLLRRNKVK